ncbi:uncharacterized protein LOC143208868 [Lasioglossum baleicum]|uniref:uncharacterized protein LOC143208868 n=1 Tax=Lasioglossum baleicum TaxID=434251 RepID=UPI003FCDFDDD
MPTLSNASDYDDEDNIITEYERHDSEAEQNTENRDAGSENEEESQGKNTARRVDPSTSRKTVVRNPVPKLDTERLTGPKGIHTIEKYFEGFKFQGKGQEKLDLDRILKRMEHWGHRLFPKLEFDSFLERLEKLGSRRDLQVFVKKYRQDMVSPDDDAIVRDMVDDDSEKEEQDKPIDEFDLLIAEQIEKQKQVNQQSSDTSTADALFDKLMSQTNNKASQQSQPVKESTGPSQLSDEVKEHIERKRQEALRRREARLKAMEEEAKRKKLGESNDTECKNSSSNAQVSSDTPSMEIDDSRKVENEKEE